MHRVDLATGKATRVGTFDVGTNFAGLGLAATANGLILGTSGRGPLLKVDPNTGVALPFTSTDWPRANSAFGALAFGPGGVLYGMGLAGASSEVVAFLVKIDLPGGHVTELGPTTELGDALAFDPPVFPALDLPNPVPTLSALAFGAMALLLTAIAVYRIRRVTRRVGGRRQLAVVVEAGRIGSRVCQRSGGSIMWESAEIRCSRAMASSVSCATGTSLSLG